MKTGPKPKPVAQRLWDKVDRSAGLNACWPYTGYLNPKGYGSLLVGSRTDNSRKNVPVHRIAWEVTYGEIPDGMFICHHCDNPPCCNPTHLFAGTQSDNMSDASRKGRARGGGTRQELCRKGHLLTDDNIYTKLNGSRQCVICKNEAHREWHRRNPDKMAEHNHTAYRKRHPDIGNHNRKKTHCPKGHPYDEANTCWNNGKRSCRTCRNEQRRKS